MTVKKPIAVLAVAVALLLGTGGYQHPTVPVHTLATQADRHTVATVADDDTPWT
jgi:hypothetical protein